MKTGAEVRKTEIGRKAFWFMGVMAMLAGFFPAAGLFAEEAASDTSATVATTDWKSEISSDKDALKAEKEQMKTNAQAAK